jgi:zinc and cadmium transporter
MLGIAIFHLLPHSLHGGQSPDGAAWWMMAGILMMFLLIRCFHFHHHGPLEISTEREDPCAVHSHDHNHDHNHDHADLHDPLTAPPRGTGQHTDARHSPRIHDFMTDPLKR